MYFGNKKMKLFMPVLLLLVIVGVMLVACTGPAGPAGSAGPRGPSGAAGPSGADAVAPQAKLVIAPSSMIQGETGVVLNVSGCGFVPGETIVFFVPNSFRSRNYPEGMLTDQYLPDMPVVKIKIALAVFLWTQ